MTDLQMIHHQEQMEAMRTEFNALYRERHLQLEQLGIDPKSTYAYTIAWIFFQSGQESSRKHKG